MGENEVPLVDDGNAATINDLFALKPFDSSGVGKGLKGIQIRLERNPYDIYISYRGNLYIEFTVGCIQINSIIVYLQGVPNVY